MAADTKRDIKLTTAGDWSVVAGDLELVSGADAIVQSVRIRLQFFKGEWFLDWNAGIPYFQSVFAKISNPQLLQDIFRKAILETVGINAIQNLTLTIDGASRGLAVSFQAETDVGLLDFSNTLPTG
jgi:hypothetical protein